MLIKNAQLQTLEKLNPHKFLGVKNTCDLAELYHENSKMSPALEKSMRDGVSLFRSPNIIDITTKIFPSIPTDKNIFLPKNFAVTKNISQVITDRLSVRDFKRKKSDVVRVSKLLYWSAGIIRASKFFNRLNKYDDLVYLRSYPSPGALFPIDIYVVVRNVSGVPQGIYFYNARTHALQLVKPGIDAVNSITSTITGVTKDTLKNSSLVVVMTVSFQRVKPKYSLRAYRLALLECGHIAQNFYLMSSALNLGCVEIGGFHDHDAEKILGIDGVNTSVLNMLVFGEPKDKRTIKRVKHSEINFGLVE